YASEKAERLGQVKTQFLANMSHEIRTPMNAIVGMSGLLMEEKMTEKQESYVSDIKRSADTLLTIINDLLDFSKLEAGKMELVPKHYNFNDLLENISSTLGFVARKKGINFNIGKIGDIPEYLFGDDTRLKQVLWNLVGNSMKFTAVGNVTLNIIDLGAELRFDIIDTGIGIREEDISRLFQAFSQVDKQNTSHVKGTGLGLSICKNIVALMEGSISVSSEYGKGSTFTFVIPKIVGDANAVEVEVHYMMICESSAKILVVDDNLINLNVATGIFGSLGIPITTCESGKSAIALLQENDFDIIFMDHMMPEMNGIEATKLIRSMGSKFEKKPIIALTANAVQGARELFLSSGMDDFISKPISKIELNKILIRWLPQDSFKTKQPEEVIAHVKKKKNDLLQLSIEKNLPELDLSLALEHTGGNWDILVMALKMFNLTIPDDCKKILAQLKNRNFDSLQMSMHGVKGALAGIGCDKEALQAALIEQASREKSLAYCKQHLPPFLNDLEGITAKLMNILSEFEFGDDY
ncbi:MAG: ATP-binding protein, partial [Thermoguttaceae bacterium]